MDTSTPEQLVVPAGEIENNLLKTTIQVRIMELQVEHENYIAQKQTQARELQAKIQDLQNDLNNMMAEANTHVANLEGAIKELERLLEI